NNPFGQNNIATTQTSINTKNNTHSISNLILLIIHEYLVRKYKQTKIELLENDVSEGIEQAKKIPIIPEQAKNKSEDKKKKKKIKVELSVFIF
ncbi:12907_t:CDS:2, partial [Ambispora leptoticha]